MNIPDFDMTVLLDISKRKGGWSRRELVDKHGPEISETIEFLLSNELVKVHEKDLKPFLPPGSDYTDPPKGNIVATRRGKIEVKRWATKRSLTRIERWKERLWGFLSGIAVSLLSWLIIALISKS